MGSRTEITLFDDTDGSTESIRTVSLTLDGQSVEVDLSQKNYDKLFKAIEPYLSAGRKTSSSSSNVRRRRGAAAKTSDTQAIRAWANEKGIEVSSRGRISADILAKYEAAHG